MEDTNYCLLQKAQELSTKKIIPNRTYTRKVYSAEQIKEILKDYIEVPRNKFTTLRMGNTRVCYLRKEDDSFCRGGFITMNPIEKKDGSETYMQLRGNVRKSSKGNVVWMVPYSAISRLWVFCGPEFEYAKAEIKKSEKKQRAELSGIVEKVTVHLRNLKREIRELKKEIKQLKDDDTHSTVTAVSKETAITSFSELKIYRTDTDTED